MLEQQKPFTSIEYGWSGSGQRHNDLSERFKCKTLTERLWTARQVEAGRKEIPNNFLFSFIFVFASSCVQVVDDDLWVMSNRMIRHIYSKLDVDDYNFRIFRTPIAEVVKGTKCEATVGESLKRKRTLRRRVTKAWRSRRWNFFIKKKTILIFTNRLNNNFISQICLIEDFLPLRIEFPRVNCDCHHQPASTWAFECANKFILWFITLAFSI